MIQNKIDYDQFKSEETRRARLSSSGSDSKNKKSKAKKNKAFRFPKTGFFSSIIDLFRNTSLLQKIGITLLVILLYRGLSSIPLPGLDMAVYDKFLNRGSTSETNYFFSIFTGSGSLDSPSIVGLGIAAYINASIMIQLLTPVIPKLTELSKDGARGQQVINQLTRYLTLPLAFMYSSVYLLFLSQRDFNSADGVTISEAPEYLIPRALGSHWPTISKVLFMAMILTAGTMFVMWLAELITENGIGNGSSIVIATGIISSLPALISRDFSNINFGNVITQILDGNFSVLKDPVFLSLMGIIIGAILLIDLIVFISESVRKIKIQNSRRVGSSEGSKDSHLPIKLTVTGVMPIIFASSFLYIPQLLVPLFERVAKSGTLFGDFATTIRNSFFFASTDQVVNIKDFWYGLTLFSLAVAFSVFYAYIQMKPSETAENLQKGSSFIPGIRPGKSTENYISLVLGRISFAGGIFLGFLALVPFIARNTIQSATGVNMVILSGIGGTSVLIIVGVVLDTYRQYQSFKATKDYEQYV